MCHCQGMCADCLGMLGEEVCVTARECVQIVWVCWERRYVSLPGNVCRLFGYVGRGGMCQRQVVVYCILSAIGGLAL